MDYEVYLRTEVFEFLRYRHSDERNRLLRLLHELSQDPYRRGDFSERDLSGRDIQVLIFQRYAISYWADHAVRELKVMTFDMRADSSDEKTSMGPQGITYCFLRKNRLPFSR
jgi:hypothetical protein